MADIDNGWHEMFSEENILEQKGVGNKTYPDEVAEPIIWHEGLERCREEDVRGITDAVCKEVYRTPKREIYWTLESCVVLHWHEDHAYWHPAMRPHERRVRQGRPEHRHYIKTKYGYRLFWHPVKRVHRTVFEC